MIEPKHNTDYPHLTWKQLCKLTLESITPFHLNLTNQLTFHAERIIRLIPKRRLVAFGTCQNQSVVIKLFFDQKRAKQHQERELQGINILIKNAIPTPIILRQGVTTDQHIYFILLQKILATKSVENIQQINNQSIQMLYALITELATQHALGILQHDLHLKNFLFTEDTIYTIDSAQISYSTLPLTKPISINNLALLLSQLTELYASNYESLFHIYAKARGWLINKQDKISLLEQIKKWKKKRWKSFNKKIFRNSSNFYSFSDSQKLIVANQHELTIELKELLFHPENMFSHPNAILLKDGRSSTVIKLTLANRHLVIKRYNIKNIWHHLRRAFRKTRAYYSWYIAHKFIFFGIETAKPIAFIEKKNFSLRNESYFITEYISSEHIGNHLMNNQANDEQILSLMKKFISLLHSLSKLNLTHGDLKMTNILIDKQHQPVLIDLDGVTEHAIQLDYQKRQIWHKEIQRFLNNFSDHTTLQKKLQHLLLDFFFNLK